MNKFDKRDWNWGGDFFREIVWDQRVALYAVTEFPQSTPLRMLSSTKYLNNKADQFQDFNGMFQN